MRPDALAPRRLLTRTREHDLCSRFRIGSPDPTQITSAESRICSPPTRGVGAVLLGSPLASRVTTPCLIFRSMRQTQGSMICPSCGKLIGVAEKQCPARGFVIFSIAGAAGFLVSNLAAGTPTIGASGSIFGLLAALIVYGRRTGSHLMTQQLWQWAVVMFVMGFLMSAVNNWAHAGGFAGGWVTAEAMRFSHEKRESLKVQLTALALIALTAVGFVLSFVRVTAL